MICKVNFMGKTTAETSWVRSTLLYIKKILLEKAISSTHKKYNSEQDMVMHIHDHAATHRFTE